MAAGSISTWSSTDKAAEAIRRSKRFMPDSVARQLDSFLSAENLSILSGTVVAWAGSHFFGVGEVADVALLLVGAFMVGTSITGVVCDLVTFGTTAINARSEEDLDRAARSFASAVVAAGVTVVFAILLKRSATKLQGIRGPNIGQVVVPRRPGLVAVEPEPPGGGAWRTPTVTGDPTMPAGQGATNAFGDVKYSTRGSATDQQLVRLHELVHSFFSPRFRIFRTFRARLAMSGYTRSVLLRYLEEALAESFAQLRTNGLSGVVTGIRFPVANGYMSLQQLVCEGAEIGKIMLGTEQFSVQFIPGPPSPAYSQ